MTELTMQQVIRFYADQFLEKADAETVQLIRAHGATLISGDPIECDKLLKVRDAMHVVLDPHYSITRSRLSPTYKAILEDGICRRVWNLCFERTWVNS